MTGTIIAVVLAIYAATLALGGALLARRMGTQRKDATPTPKRQREDYVTRDELEAAIEKVTKNLEWEWTEMYDKFQKLHLRLTKRDKRAQDQLHLHREDAEEPRPSVINYRRLGSP